MMQNSSLAASLWYAHIHIIAIRLVKGKWQIHSSSYVRTTGQIPAGAPGDCFRHKNIKEASPLDRPIFYTRNQPFHSAQGQERLGFPVDNGSMPIRGVGRLPGPLSDQLWWHLKSSKTPPPLEFGKRGIHTDLVFDHCIIIQARVKS